MKSSYENFEFTGLSSSVFYSLNNYFDEVNKSSELMIRFGVYQLLHEKNANFTEKNIIQQTN